MDKIQGWDTKNDEETIQNGKNARRNLNPVLHDGKGCKKCLEEDEITFLKKS